MMMMMMMMIEGRRRKAGSTRVPPGVISLAEVVIEKAMKKRSSLGGGGEAVAKEGGGKGGPGKLREAEEAAVGIEGDGNHGIGGGFFEVRGIKDDPRSIEDGNGNGEGRSDERDGRGLGGVGRRDSDVISRVVDGDLLASEVSKSGHCTHDSAIEDVPVDRDDVDVDSDGPRSRPSDHSQSVPVDAPGDEAMDHPTCFNFSVHVHHNPTFIRRQPARRQT